MIRLVEPDAQFQRVGLIAVPSSQPLEMAAASVPYSPEPAPSDGDLPLAIEGLIMAAAVTAGAVAVTSLLTRRSSNPLLRITFQVTSSLYLPLVSYVISDDSNYSFPLQLVSMVFLLCLAHLARSQQRQLPLRGRGEGDGIDTANPFLWLPAALLRDADVDYLTDAGWAGYLVYAEYSNERANGTKKIWGSPLLHRSIWILWALIVLKILLKVAAFQLQRRSFAFENNAKLVAGYMKQQQQRQLGLGLDLDLEESDNESQDFSFFSHPSSYRYLVMGEDELTRVLFPDGYRILEDDPITNQTMITVNSLWKSGGSHRLHFLRSGRLPLLYLSFALFKLLRRRFECVRPLAESNTARARALAVLGPLRDHGQAFRIVELQLGFATDYYHSPLPITYSGWFLILHLLLFAPLLYYSVRTLIKIYDHFHAALSETGYSQFHNGRTILYLDVASITMVVSITLLIEALEMLAYVRSDWATLALLGRCVKKLNGTDPPRGRGLCKAMLELVQRMQSATRRPRPRKLRQYSLLQRFTTRNLLRCKCRAAKVELTEPVTAAIARALVRTCELRDGRLGDGGDSLMQWSAAGDADRQEIADEFTELRRPGMGTSEMLLVWHVATTYCDMKHSLVGVGSSDDCSNDNNRKVASILSNYCAYLVASHPQLLPDDTDWTKDMFKRVSNCKETHAALKGCSDKEVLLNAMERLDGDHQRVIAKGAQLGRKLMKVCDDTRRKEMWKLLADLWAELILYAAPSHNVDAHRAALAEEGEFITHVWALLSNVGIIDRPATTTG